jgi:O-antigen/teichoic acid export membrane protein
MIDLKERAIRGGAAKFGAQAANFVLRMGSLMILARLLPPSDFGLVGMVTAFTGVLSLFREFGLSTASVQRATITERQISTLFWINMLVGAVLAVVCIVSAPLIAAFYREPRLYMVSVVLASSFLFNAAGVQHSALLQRQLRFTELAVIEILSLFISTIASVGVAFWGLGYWALVVWSVTLPLAVTVMSWVATGWVPGRPHAGTGMRSMMRFGGTLTLNNLVVYTAYNLDKVLIGRFWGAEIAGIYGRAYQLVTLPMDVFNGAAGSVVFPVLARVQDDVSRLRSYFLKAYSLVLALTVPITLFGAIFANDVILALLGPQWTDAAPVLRLMAPTVLIFAVINPTGWWLVSLGMVGRSLKLALVIAPVVVTGCWLGLPYGPKGVALGTSIAMGVWVVPHLLWCLHGTNVSIRDVMLVASRPLASGMAGALPASAVAFLPGVSLPPLVRLLLGGIVFLGVYAWVLLFAMRQKALYLDLVRGLGIGATAKPALYPQMHEEPALVQASSRT